MTYLTAFLALALLLTACNNDRTQRLDASRYCRPSLDTSAELTEKEIEDEIFNSVNLPEDERLEVTNFVSTVELVDANENKIVMTLTGTIKGNTSSVSLNCLRGATVDSYLTAPSILLLPVRNGSSEFTQIEITIDGKKDGDFITSFPRVTSKIINPVESNADNIEEAPQPFSSYFAEEETSAYQLKKGKNKEDNFNYHILSVSSSEGFLKASTRMNLTRVALDKEN